MEITIPEFKEVEEEGKTFILYTVKIVFKEWQSTSLYRYSHLLRLHQNMKLMWRALRKPLPHFPGKLIWKQIFKKLKPEEINKRKDNLERYLQELVRTDYPRYSEFLMMFIGMPQQIRNEWYIWRNWDLRNITFADLPYYPY